MSSPLFRLPYELLSFVVKHLDLEDTRSLSLTCKQLQFLFHEPRIAKSILLSKAPGTLEARSAELNNNYPAELRRLVKRREAISSVSPYLAAVVSVACNTWLYENGTLLHILEPRPRERQLRILDLHRSQSSEIIIDIRGLLDDAIPESRGFYKYKFRPLYYSHDVVSCLYTHAQRDRPPASWLVVFSARDNSLLTAQRLDSSFKIFVRNNARFLVYGTYSPTGLDDSRRWVVGSYDLANPRSPSPWTKQQFDLPEPMGSDIGSTICFEIFGDFFYGLSSQTSLEVEEIDWMSYYTCFRFPLTPDGPRKLEHAPRRQLWRRYHFEGPIDDRWSFLRIFKDETTTQLRAVESRKEWLAGSSSARRSYYTTEITFRSECHRSHSQTAEGPSMDAAELRLPRSSKTNQPDFETAPTRDPHLVHSGDDGATSLMFTLSKSPVRCYHSACQTFIDLVDDPSDLNPSVRRVRIRGASRRRWTPSESEERSRLVAATRQYSHNTFDHTLAEMYKHEDVIFWPPEQNPAEPDSALNSLYWLLNQQGHYVSICGTWDERSLLYALEDAEGLKTLVFLSFDPSLSLKGVKAYPGNPNRGNLSGYTREKCRVDARNEVQDTAWLYDGKGKGKEINNWSPTSEPNATCCPDKGTTSDIPSANPESAGDGRSVTWRTHQAAMFQDISVGYHFAL